MDINNIQFPASALANLYKHSLVDTSNEADTPGTTPENDFLDAGNPSPGNWKFIGENKKNILVVVDHADVVHLPDEDLSFLTTMLAACKLSLADVAIVNRNNYEGINYKELLSNFKSRIIFLYGTDPVSFGLPLSFPQYQIQSFANATFLFTPTLGEIKIDGILKSKLWVCLRRIFVI